MEGGDSGELPSVIEWHREQGTGTLLAAIVGNVLRYQASERKMVSLSEVRIGNLA